MEVKFEASKAELIELSKMAYIAQYVVDSSGRFSTGYHYLYLKEFESALRLFNKMLLQHIGDVGLLEVDEQSQDIFTHTMLMEDECQKVMAEFQKACFIEELCDGLTDRDHDEQYGVKMREGGFRIYDEAYQILHDKNMRELKTHGLKRLRIEE